MRVTRRAFVGTATAGMAGLLTGAAVHGYAFERHALRLIRTELPLPALPEAFDGLGVGFITDLHHSEYVSAAMVAQAVALVMAERPELILLGGDYVTFFDRRYIGGCAELLASLDAPLGVFAVLGNHDDDRHVPAALAARGVTVLRDTHTVLERRGDRLGLAGLDFWTREPARIAPALRGLSTPSLLLAHDPRRVIEAEGLGIPAVVSGHTHGGQVVLPVIGALAARKFPVASGHLDRRRTHLFVSRGVGTVLLPIRVNCPPEVVLMTLRRAEEPHGT